MIFFCPSYPVFTCGTFVSVGSVSCDRVTADVPAGPIGDSLLKDPPLTTGAGPSFIPLAWLLYFSSDIEKLSNRIDGSFIAAVKPSSIEFHSLLSSNKDVISLSFGSMSYISSSHLSTL